MQSQAVPLVILGWWEIFLPITRDHLIQFIQLIQNNAQYYWYPEGDTKKKATPQSRTFSVFTKIGYWKIGLDLLVGGLGDENNSFIFISVHTT